MTAPKCKIKKQADLWDTFRSYQQQNIEKYDCVLGNAFNNIWWDGYVTTPANKLTGIYGVAPTDCSPNPVLLILHNYIFQVKKHENHENQHLPLCSFVTVIKYGVLRIIRFVVEMINGCIPPMNWWGLACTILKRKHNLVFGKQNTTNAHEVISDDQ